MSKHPLCPCCGRRTPISRPLVDVEGRTIAFRGARASLSPNEAEALATLSAAFPDGVDEVDLVEEIWGGDPPDYYQKSLRNTLDRIDRKIARLGLVLIRGSRGPTAVNKFCLRPSPRRGYVLDPERRAEIAASSESVRELAKRYGIGASTAHRLKNGQVPVEVVRSSTTRRGTALGE